eukprot:1161263-Pelagomonas_calceolata.AAC.6
MFIIKLRCVHLPEDVRALEECPFPVEWQPVVSMLQFQTPEIDGLALRNTLLRKEKIRVVQASGRPIHALYFFLEHQTLKASLCVRTDSDQQLASGPEYFVLDLVLRLDPASQLSQNVRSEMEAHLSSGAPLETQIPQFCIGQASALALASCLRMHSGTELRRSACPYLKCQIINFQPQIHICSFTTTSSQPLQAACNLNKGARTHAQPRNIASSCSFIVFPQAWTRPFIYKDILLGDQRLLSITAPHRPNAPNTAVPAIFERSEPALETV